MVQKSVKLVKKLFYDDESFLSKSDFEIRLCMNKVCFKQYYSIFDAVSL